MAPAQKLFRVTSLFKEKSNFIGQRFCVAHINSTSTFTALSVISSICFSLKTEEVWFCLCVGSNAGDPAHFESDPVADVYDCISHTPLLAHTGWNHSL